MMSLTFTAARSIGVARASTLAARTLSTQTECAVAKLRGVLEEYRAKK